MADERNVVEALRAGAQGYLPKDAPIAQIVEAIRAAARGESLIAPRVAGYLVQRLRRPPTEEVADAAGLTPRELEILELMARGMGNIEIGKALHLGQHTVKNQVSSVLRKLQVKNRSQAAVHAVRPAGSCNSGCLGGAGRDGRHAAGLGLGDQRAHRDAERGELLFELVQHHALLRGVGGTGIRSVAQGAQSYVLGLERHRVGAEVGDRPIEIYRAGGQVFRRRGAGRRFARRSRAGAARRGAG